MKAAVLRAMGLPAPYAQSRPLSIEEVELAPPGPGELRVRIRAAGLCHSDLSVVNGDRAWPMPIVLGHEAAAEVVEIGPGGSDLAIGDAVVMIFRPSCGTCLSCAGGRPALCAPGGESNGTGSLLGGYKRLSASGGRIGLDQQSDGLLNHHMGCSAFAQFATVSRRSLVRIDPGLSWDEAALFGCAVLTGAGAVFNTARMEPGARAAVVGLGGVGFSSLLAAAAGGARDIVAVDLLDSKLAIAGGVDYAFEMAGSVKALDLAYKITARGGTTVTAGLPNPSQQWSIQAVSLIAEERTVKGSYIGSCVPARDVPRFVAMYRAGRLPVDRLLSERVPLADINQALDRLARGEAIRQIILTD